ncbi:MAG TPA: ferrochelatase [Acidiferrobacteraceae bacterium]|nr:ferrochelatase [Acidiferrobacteraceae bacterium]
MSRFAVEPAVSDPCKIGVLLTNLGTPSAPTTAAVRSYLREFLLDPRVVEIPRLLWGPILYGAVLTVRPRRSAALYRKIWMPEGSPLLVYSQRQARALEERLEARLSQPVRVALGMRYGEPSIAAALADLKEAGCDRILVLPLYPQYAASTTGSTFDALARVWTRTRRVPALRVVAGYAGDPGYIAALADSIRRYWKQHGQGRLLISFHGLPKRAVDLGDPYRTHCEKTAQLLVATLGLDREQYAVAFQSRFGAAEWLQPYTFATLEDWARTGTRRADVVCPGFPADCLETLEEIAMGGKDRFLASGGQEFHYIPALNTDPRWIDALSNLAIGHLHGWVGTGSTAP